MCFKCNSKIFYQISKSISSQLWKQCSSQGQRINYAWRILKSLLNSFLLNKSHVKFRIVSNYCRACAKFQKSWQHSFYFFSICNHFVSNRCKFRYFLRNWNFRIYKFRKFSNNFPSTHFHSPNFNYLVIKRIKSSRFNIEYNINFIFNHLVLRICNQVLLIIDYIRLHPKNNLKILICLLKRKRK